MQFGNFLRWRLLITYNINRWVYATFSSLSFNSLIGVAGINTIRLSTSPSNLYLVQTLKNNTSYLSNNIETCVIQKDIHSFSHNVGAIRFAFLSLFGRLTFKIQLL